MLRSAIAVIVSFGCATSIVASEWRLERDAGEARILVASSTMQGDLTFKCEPGSGAFSWHIANLPPHPANGMSVGTMLMHAGLLDRPLRFAYLRIDTRLISPANERALSGTPLVRLREESRDLRFGLDRAVIGLPGPALDAQTLLSQARAAEATGTTLRLGSYVFEPAGIDAAMTRLLDACLGPRD